MEECWAYIERQIDHLSGRVLDFSDNEIVESLYDDILKCYKRLYEIKMDKDRIIERQTHLLKGKRAELAGIKNVLLINVSNINWYNSVLDSITKEMDSLENMNEYGWLYVKCLFDYFYFMRTIAECENISTVRCHDVMNNVFMSTELYFTYPFWLYYTRLQKLITQLLARMQLSEELDLVRGFKRDLKL